MMIAARRYAKRFAAIACFSLIIYSATHPFVSHARIENALGESALIIFASIFAALFSGPVASRGNRVRTIVALTFVAVTLFVLFGFHMFEAVNFVRYARTGHPDMFEEQMSFGGSVVLPLMLLPLAISAWLSANLAFSGWGATKKSPSAEKA